MADSNVTIDEGTGVNIDTRTETGGDHRQVIVVGDPSTTAGVAPVDGTNGLAVDIKQSVALSISGTVTANLGATDNAVLDTIATNTGAAIAAGTNHIGAAGAVLETSSMRDAGSAVTPKFAAINVAGSGDNTLVAAVASKKIRVLAFMAMAGGTVNVRLESGAAGTALTGVMELLAQTGFVLPYNPVGWCETAVNTLLNLELSAAVNVDGVLTYVEVD